MSTGFFSPGPLPVAVAFLLAACGEHPAAPPPAPPEVTVLAVQAREIPAEVEYVAQTQSSRQVEVSTRVAGFLDRRVYTEGAFVKEGEVMFLIDRKPFEAKLAYAKAALSQREAAWETARANLARVRPLAEQDALSKKDLDDAVGNEKANAAEVEAARAQVLQAELDLSYTTIKAPVSGLSSFARRQEGSYLPAMGQESLLTYVARLDPMRVVFSLSESELLKLREEVQSGRLKVPENNNYQVELKLADGTIYEHRGHITFTDASFSPESGTYLIRADVENPKAVLLPGQFVRARLIGAVWPNAIAIPQSAVQQGAKGSFAWVVGKDSKVEIRPVEVGAWHGDDWIVTSGLAAGDRVITSGGGPKLAPGVAVKVADAPDAAQGGVRSAGGGDSKGAGGVR
ncbi:MAG: efflux RND transporter periplasmic adaptor subunit [Betaproteobacteria bacterium]|nr:efflux RND transporter periplasmic adaptor subunit [Betaproteobacteria bacterium]